MKFKAGIVLNGIQPEMLLAMSVVDHVYRDVSKVEPTMTSALDSHKTGLHPKGLAGDFRVHDVPANLWITLADAIRQRLNSYRTDFSTLYDVVLEYSEKGNEHIHVEYDPKLKKTH